uniref:Centriolar coiled-coil protein of 110 kDa-like n=1 Tax=Esox lucius TaxID=8010 RepID=A0A6Q2XBI1_ESOLU
MEDYNEFCSRAMVHLQRERGRRNPIREPERMVVSSIQFHGRPILLPLLNKDQHKQMVQYKQLVDGLEAERQRLRSSSLLSRVQGILNGVRLFKVTDKQPTCGTARLEHMANSSTSPPNNFFTDRGEEQEAETGESCPRQGVSLLGRSESTVSVIQGDPGSWEEYTSDVHEGDCLVSGVAHSPVRYQHPSYPNSPDSLLGSSSHSLTGSYARLPSPRALLSPALSGSTPGSHARLVPLGSPKHSLCPVAHPQRSSPASAGNILISCPMSAADLSPVVNRKGRVTGRRVPVPVTEFSRGLNLQRDEPWNASLSEFSFAATKEEVSWSDTNATVSGCVSRPEILSSTWEKSSLKHVPACHSLRAQPISGPVHTSSQSRSRIRTSQRQPRHSPHRPNPCLRSSPAGQPLYTPSQGPVKSSTPQQSQCSSPTPLNRSYDVQSPLPNLLRPHVVSESPGLRVEDRPSPGVRVEDRPSPGLRVEDRPSPGLRVEDKPSPGLRVEDRPSPGLRVEDRPSPGLRVEDRPSPVLRVEDRPSPGLRVEDRPSPGLRVTQDMSLEDRLSLGQSPGRVQHSTLDLTASEASCDGSRLTLSFLDSGPTEQDRKTMEIQRQIEALEEMRHYLQEDHARQLSLLLSEQHRQQQTLTQPVSEERGLRRPAYTEPPSGAPGTCREVWVNPSETPVLPFFFFTSPRPGERSSEGRLRPKLQHALGRLGAVVRGFLTRRLLHTERVKQLRKTVWDTKEFIRSLSTDSTKKGALSPQVRTLQERGRAQLRAALFDVHEIFFTVPVRERLALIQQDRELRTERTLRDMEKSKSPRDKVVLSAATQKSLERKKKRMIESLRQGKKTNQKPKILFTSRILQPSQDQNTISFSNLPTPESGSLGCKDESGVRRSTVT